MKKLLTTLTLTFLAAAITLNATPNKVTTPETGSPNRLVLPGGKCGKRMRDDLFLYRPGRGAVSLLKSNGNGIFNPVYAAGDNGPALPNGIGGYDLLSSNDQVFPFDYDGDGKDDLFLYRPSTGAAFVLNSNGDGNFTHVNSSQLPNGIGGHDLLSLNDQAFPFDFDGDGRDDLFLYRPGTGAVFVLKSNGDGNFTPVIAVGDNGSAPLNGIGGYDLLSPRDRVFPFDYDGNGKDDLFLYRPGAGAVSVLKWNGDKDFIPVFATFDNGSAPPNGIFGYDLLSVNDRVFPFDYDGDGKDDLFLYRPGTGSVFVLKSNGDGTFPPLPLVQTPDNGPTPPNGIFGYDLLSVNDQVFPFDYDGDGKDDLFLYRPGTGSVFVLRSNGNGIFSAVITIPDNGSALPNGISGYDLLSVNDRVFPFDLDKNGKDDLFLYRPGTGSVFVLKSNGDGTFPPLPLAQTPDNGPAPPNGIFGYDLLSTSDRVFALDYNRW